ncbi:MAG: tRNA (N(6)-L-threonylcarbamoyladenosine(37)-C(2))-methylthiotransferase MtaB [Candidatus Margulisiibacteriota bacterium]|jgi:threonylcarbamoyladenosine tRNA methylthiotransferase MtaB
MTKIFFKTFGCRVNQAETSLLMESFSNQNFLLTNDFKNADIAVINTCALTKNSEHDLNLFLNKITKYNPEIKIALIGCLSELKKDFFFKTPNINWIIGNEKKLELVEIITNNFNHKNYLLTPPIQKNNFQTSLIGQDSSRTRASLKIQDGCNEFCSYCIVPYVRGSLRSRDFNNIINSYQKLIAKNYKEIIITGINVGKYFNSEKDLFDLLYALLLVSPNTRLRLSSIEPNTINQEKLINLLNKFPNFCQFLHMPLQSGSEKILKLMNRKYTIEDYQEIVSNLHQAFPNLAIGTDVIVGFPEETDSDFNITYELLKHLPLSYFHIFSYSDRPGTKSEALTNKVSPQVIKKRSKILRDLSLEKKQKFIDSQLNLEKPILFEEKKDGLWVGHTDNYLKIHLKSEENLRNKFINVKLCKDLIF